MKRKSRFNIFTWMGNYYSHWYTNPIPFLRRLAKNNPNEYGKLVVFGSIMAWVNFYLITHTEQIANFFVEKAFGTDKVETLPTKEEILRNIVTNETFEKRFGRLNPGDEITFTQGGEHMDAVFVRYSRDDQLEVRTDSGPFLIDRPQVLDVTPTF